MIASIVGWQLMQKVPARVAAPTSATVVAPCSTARRTVRSDTPWQSTPTGAAGQVSRSLTSRTMSTIMNPITVVPSTV